MIVQELNKIQHDERFLPPERLSELSERMAIPLYRLHEVASYFPHYRFTPPPAVEVKVCRDMACDLRNSAGCRQRLEELAREIGGNQVQVGGVSCLGQCDRAPAVSINDRVYRGLAFDRLTEIIRAENAGTPPAPQSAGREPLTWSIDPYQGKPEYRAVRKLVEQLTADSGELSARRRKLGDAVLEEIKTANLRGMGGAAFHTHRKWSTVRDAPGDLKYVVSNGDESEPGTFKDRELLRRAPHLLIEGMVINALVTGGRQGYIFIRHEYAEEIQAVRDALENARQQGVWGDSILGCGIPFELEVFVSPGGYICGEETALLEAIEDRRAEPRNKPPLMSLEGLRGKPTSMNNIETFSWVPSIILHGGPWYRDQGLRGAMGMRLVCISGDVVRPGVYEVPFGYTVRELIYQSAGGIRDGRDLKAIAPSGPSGGFLPTTMPAAAQPREFVEGLIKAGVLSAEATTIDLLALPMEPTLFKPFPDFMLGAACVVYAEGRDMVRAALNCTQFFRNESCGKCVPCRLGSQKLVEMLEQFVTRRATLDSGLVVELSDAMFQTAICGLGHVASNPIRTVMRYFPDDLKRYVQST